MTVIRSRPSFLFSLIKSANLLAVLVFLSGCMAMQVQMYPGAPQPDRQAIIRGEHYGKSSTAPFVQIAKVDDQYTECDLKQIFQVFPHWPDTVYVLPGKHTIITCINQQPSVISFHLWLIAEPGGQYVVRHKTVGYDHRMWIEDEKTGKVVGGLVGSVDEPKPLDYREVSDEINQQAREQLMKVIAGCADPAIQQGLISTNGICGPLLWLKIQPYATLRGLNWSPAYFRIPYIDPDSGERCVQPAEGRILQAETEMLEFWGALHYELNVTTNDVIRRLTPTEKEQLWAMTPFDYLEEPIFIIEGADYRIMTLMIEEDGRYLPFWMDDFQLLSTNVTRGVVEEAPQSGPNQPGSALKK